MVRFGSSFRIKVLAGQVVGHNEKPSAGSFASIHLVPLSTTDHTNEKFYSKILDGVLKLENSTCNQFFRRKETLRYSERFVFSRSLCLCTLLLLLRVVVRFFSLLNSCQL